MKIKEEDGERDRFVEFLRLAEGREYRTVGTDVKVSSGKDFDYLLQETEGHSLALEVTRLVDKDEGRLDIGMKRFEQCQQVFKSLVSGGRYRDAGLWVGIPYYSPYKGKRTEYPLSGANAEAAQQELLAAIDELVPGQSISFALGEYHFVVELKSGLTGVRYYSIGGGQFRTHDSFKEEVEKLIAKKNDQLDIKDCRRVLFIGNANIFASPGFIKGFVVNFIESNPSKVSNIDEVFVDFGVNEIERVYP